VCMYNASAELSINITEALVQLALSFFSVYIHMHKLREMYTFRS